MSTHPLKRVKVSFKDDKLVMPVASSIAKVSDLLSEATIRFRAQRMLAKDDSFIQVRTIDGYIISPTDNVEDVIEQSDHLVLVNRSAWIADFKASCQPTYWYASLPFAALPLHSVLTLLFHLFPVPRFGLRQFDHKASCSRFVPPFAP